MKRTALLATFFTLAPASSALAHSGHGLESGFLHPFTGADHLFVMLAIGAWAAMLGGRALLALPAGFIAATMAGAFMAAAGAPLPFAETMILASVVLFVVFVAFRVRMSAGAAAGVVVLFALAHGNVHVLNMPAGVTLWSYGAGFLIATAVIHALGAVVMLYILHRKSPA